MQIQRERSNCPGTLGTKTSDDNCFTAELKSSQKNEREEVNLDKYIMEKLYSAVLVGDVFVKIIKIFKQASFLSDL